MLHYRKTFRLYKQRRAASVTCPFCAPETLANALVTTDAYYIVPNLTKYDLWESHDVEHHLMIIPRRHVESLADLDNHEMLEIMKKIADYEHNGYSVYARGVGFSMRSVKHQHTHLIKASNTHPRLTIFMRKPYMLIKR